MGQLIPVMNPAPGERLQKFVGDAASFSLKKSGDGALTRGWSARLRTNLGRAETLRHEIIEAHTNSLPIAGASWRDLAMREVPGGWALELPLAEVGFFKAKAYLVDPNGWQHWPEGSDIGISVHPNSCRTANTIYCAFPRLFGATRTGINTRNETLENQIQQIEDHGFTIIPPSGKLRDLIQALPHIVNVLGCRVLHLLPVNPPPTTYARFGRFGSPYAALDLTAIDPALVVFDKRTTGVDQFRELTYAVHERGGRVIIDIVINHTGWGSMLQENHPEWFLRNADGTFASPGAWGTTWEDLVELKHDNVALWDQLSEMFLTWCRRGVDGFRCDAGYKVPLPAWQYIIARVQQEFPETIFLLEGLGGSWEATEALLTEGGMQWAYSELFQNYSGREVAGYLDYALRQSERVGLYVHYSETHDNSRLAAQRTGEAPPDGTRPDRVWSLLRNRLCALTSVTGGFGFTCGVEWLATEKIRVHGSTGLAWGNADNLVSELVQVNRLLAEHPCFFDGAKLTRLSPDDSWVYALLRESAEGLDRVLVLVNTDAEREQTLSLADLGLEIADLKCDLLGQALPQRTVLEGGKVQIRMAAAAACCLALAARPNGLSGDAYRHSRALAAWGIQALSQRISTAILGSFEWRALAELVRQSAAGFLVAIDKLDHQLAEADLLAALRQALESRPFPNVIRWSLNDRRRVTPIPPGHWLLIEDKSPFRVTLDGNGPAQHRESIFLREGHIACFAPRIHFGDATLVLERYAETDREVQAAVRFLAPEPSAVSPLSSTLPAPDARVLLTNGIGGMARFCVDIGRVTSKYDCVLGANLHPSLPVDRHVFAKRIRVWVIADGFISPLNYQNLAGFRAGPPAVWQFVANAGDGRTVEIEMRAGMFDGKNTTAFSFSRPSARNATGKQLPDEADVRLTVRIDIEDRNFHSQTHRNGGAEHHFAANTHSLEPGVSSSEINEWKPEARAGFSFTPSADRQLCAFADSGRYHPEPEWCECIPHPVEQSRGHVGSGDAYSPGWFELGLPKGGGVNLVVTAEAGAITDFPDWQTGGRSEAMERRTAGIFEAQLIHAARQFVVRRGEGKTVIAGYPWFLDWGRDTFICARGLIAAGLLDEVEQILVTFARFEISGTLPNTIHGADASNRDTSDAPLWFGIVCDELAAARGNFEDRTAQRDFYKTCIDDSGRTILDVLKSIASHYISGTPNGIRMDTASALIWSPGHFTWMDTNYPAGTAREGYPIEIQALWIRLLRQLAAIGENPGAIRWSQLAERALTSVEKYFWLEDRGWYADLLIAPTGQTAAGAIVSDALRSNCLFLIGLGLVAGEWAKRCVASAQEHLVIPGALRSLAPLPLSVPLPVYGNHGGLLNNPVEPYWGRYEGEEDTQRKPAYHNGTAWTWTFPAFCEALARAWDFAPEAVAAARAYLGSIDQIMREGCIGQIPEVLDGDTPHTPRGCDAQAWSATEVLRVWTVLKAGTQVEP
jgi:starch synthase (maltosyl-transferring)